VKLFEDQPQILQLTVSQFSERLQNWIKRRPELQQIAIVGEISDWNLRQNGNAYFKLKDERAVLSCFAYWSEARRFPEARDGVAVVATGQVCVWERQSEYRLRVMELAPFGVGAIAAKVEALRKRLQSEGLFDEARKRVFPRFPRRVALVSARGRGAADFETTLREKAPNVGVTFVETRVQGEGAEIDIAEALQRASSEDVDAVILLRGGGSYEDRYPFNTEAVVRAIARSRHPVVTAIGHTGDRHLADEVADAVFKTPTAAAEYIAGSWAEVTGRLSRQNAQLERAIDAIVVRGSQRRDYVEHILAGAIAARLSHARQRLLELDARLERQSPRHRAAVGATRLTALNLRIDNLRERVFSGLSNALALSKSRLLSSNPEGPLERGYAIVTHAGRALRDARSVRAGDEIVARLHRGSLGARVERVFDDE
jgi:exodeoxyribonuclease VII large subunit